MKSQSVTVRCPEGLHLRVASEIAKIAMRAEGSVHVHCEGCPRANACSVLELLTLGATLGTPLEIVVDSPDEDSVLQALTDVFEAGGGI